MERQTPISLKQLDNFNWVHQLGTSQVHEETYKSYNNVTGQVIEKVVRYARDPHQGGVTVHVRQNFTNMDDEKDSQMQC